jgi:23S rRNA (guanosine2251-2'-O)-methyltransferase
MPNNYSSKDQKKTPAASYGRREKRGFAPAGGRSTGDNPRERSGFRPAAARKAENSPRRTGRSFQDGKTERDSSRKNAGYRDFEYRDEARPHRERIPAFEPRPEQEADTEKYILTGRNPIREALKNHRDLEKLMVQKGDLSGSALEIIQKAKEQKIMIQTVDKSRLDEIAPRHQGLIAFASAYQYCTVEDILEAAREKGEAPFIIILDGVTDPHNLGAIIRTAECVGAHGVIVPQHRSVGLTPAAVKSSAGAVEYVKVARVMNLNRTIEELQKENIWVYALTMNGKDFREVSFEGGTALVIGAEGEGISRLTEEKCDESVSLPMKGHLDSLNASVAAGIMMYRVFTSRNE